MLAGQRKTSLLTTEENAKCLAPCNGDDRLKVQTSQSLLQPEGGCNPYGGQAHYSEIARMLVEEVASSVIVQAVSVSSEKGVTQQSERWWQAW